MMKFRKWFYEANPLYSNYSVHNEKRKELGKRQYELDLRSKNKSYHESGGFFVEGQRMQGKEPEMCQNPCGKGWNLRGCSLGHRGGKEGRAVGGKMDYLRQQDGTPPHFLKANHSPWKGKKSPSLSLRTGALWGIFYGWRENRNRYFKIRENRGRISDPVLQ